MKKILFFAAVTLAAASCLKQETVVSETSQELSFKAIAKVATKADAQHEGAYLQDDYRIYASATQKKADGTLEHGHYLNDEPFDTETAAADAVYKHWSSKTEAGEANTMYWPIGGCQLDFLAYAMPLEKYNNAAEAAPKATFPNEATDIASLLKFEGWDTYLNQVDVLYSNVNGASAGKNIALKFEHAQALLVFEAKVNVSNVLTINKIQIPDLLVKGDFVVDNTKNILNASWEKLVTVKDEDIIAAGEDPTSDNLGEVLTSNAYVQVGSSLLIPQQPALNFTIFYTLNGQEQEHKVNVARKSWEKSKKYIYKLDFQLNELLVEEDVVDFDADGQKEEIEESLK